VSEGRRHEFVAFGWKPDDVPDPQSPETFARSRLDWSEPGREPHASVLAWHRQLIRIRRRLPSRGDGRLEPIRVRFDETARWLAIDHGPLTVACNLADTRTRVPVERGDLHLQLASDPSAQLVGHGVELPPVSVSILVKDADA
jgi:maltooligosyltrehalose trehalohydrolase